MKCSFFTMLIHLYFHLKHPEENLFTVKMGRGKYFN